MALNYLVVACAPSTALFKKWTVDAVPYGGYLSLKHIEKQIVLYMLDSESVRK